MVSQVCFTVTRYGYRRWGWFRGAQRFGFNAGRLAFRWSYRKDGQHG